MQASHERCASADLIIFGLHGLDYLLLCRHQAAVWTELQLLLQQRVSNLLLRKTVALPEREKPPSGGIS